jgi:hypothetical protein
MRAVVRNLVADVIKDFLTRFAFQNARTGTLCDASVVLTREFLTNAA